MTEDRGLAFLLGSGSSWQSSADKVREHKQKRLLG